MLSTMSYKLNGVVLDTENCLVIVGSTLMPGISTRRTVTTVRERNPESGCSARVRRA